MNGIRKYKMLTIIWAMVNVFVIFFSRCVTFEREYVDWIYNYYNEAIYLFSIYISFITAFLWLYKKKNKTFLIINIVLQVSGLVLGLFYFVTQNMWNPFNLYWDFGAGTLLKNTTYILNIILGIFFSQYYSEHKDEINNKKSILYYVVGVVCIIAAIIISYWFWNIWWENLDPALFPTDD